ncbi:hypothetical protein [Patulibacter defluvii]|uniref:hypothetical protein n=1 Tax=Patulibacter defluvii TaxID=3095358 RepID=UPI002A7599D9|nr:hypothetical protein [Patulibacter sp. DM4]
MQLLRTTPTPARLARLAAVALCAATLAACGADAKDDPTAQADRAYDGALKFAKCMREHGVDMPDPKRQGNGGIAITSKRAGRDGPDDGKMQAADKACQKFLQEGAGPPPSPAEQAKMRDRFLRYTRCMRQKGVDMPDPQFSGDGAVTMRIGGPKGKAGGGPRPDSPRFKRADEACHELLGEGPGGAKPAMAVGSEP